MLSSPPPQLLFTCHLASSPEVGHLHPFGHQVKAALILLKPNQVKDLVNISFTVLFNELKSLRFVYLNHLQFFFRPQVAYDDELRGTKLQGDEELFPIDEFDLDKLEVFRISMSYPLEIAHLIKTTFSLLPARDLINDYGVTCDVFDDCFGLPPVFLEPVQLVV